MRRKPNNVYGQMIAPGGLRPAVAAIEEALGPGSASMFRTSTADAEGLRARTDAVDLESLPLPGGMEHLLNGVIEGPADEIVRIVRSISAAFDEAKIEHTFEVHDGRRVVLSLPAESIE